MPLKRYLSNPHTPFTAVNVLKDHDVIYRKLDTLPTNSQGVLSLSTDVEFATNSTYYNNGYTELDNNLGTLLPINWKIQGWFKFNIATISSIFTLEGSLFFTLRYDDALKVFSLIYSPTPGDAVVIDRPLNIPSGWHFITIIRDADILKVFIDLEKKVEILDLYFPAYYGDLFLGKDPYSNTHLKAKVQSFLLDLSPTAKIPLLSDLATYRNYYVTSNSVNDFSESILLKVGSKELENTSIFPKQGIFTTYDFLREVYSIVPSAENIAYSVNPRGLYVTREDDKHHFPSDFELDTVFSLSGLTSNVCIFSNYDEVTRIGAFIRYQSIDASLQLTYYNTTLNSVNLGTYEGGYVKLTLKGTSDSVSIYKNGTLVAIINHPVFNKSLVRFKFNYNNFGIVNSSTNIALSSFKLTRIDSINGTYFVGDSPDDIYTTQKIDEVHFPFRYHQVNSREFGSSYFIPFSVSHYSININTGSNFNLTITQPEITHSVEYTVTVIPANYSDLDEIDVLVNRSFSILSGATSKVLNIGIASNLINKKIKYCRLLISNGTFKTEVIINITNTSTFNISSLQGQGYIEGIFASNSLQGWSTRNGTSVLPQSNNSLYGSVYYLNNTNTISLTPSVDNVRTVFLVYHELQTVPNRLYFGGDSYTFNGGPLGELVGDLLISSDDLIRTVRDERIIKSVVISQTETNPIIVYVVESDNSIEIKKKGTTWDVSPISLTLGLQEPSSLDSSSLALSNNGQFLAIGCPNANNGEGVVQIWDTTTVNKLLHIGSPEITPTIGGFGKSVAISNDGNTLFVSEVSSNNIYIYRKIVDWSPIPIATISETIPIISISLKDSYLAVTLSNNSIKIYQENNALWNSVYVYTDKDGLEFDPLSNKLTVLDSFIGNVKIYEIPNFTNPTHTIQTSPAYLGTTVKISNSNILISDLSTSTVSYYTQGNYITPKILESTYSDYGSYMAIGNATVVISNYEDIMDIYSSDSASYGERVKSVYVDGLPVSKSDILDTDNIHIYTFILNAPMLLNKIGTTQIASSGVNVLNGLFLGSIFYSEELNAGKIKEYSDLLKRYLNIQELKLSDL